MDLDRPEEGQSVVIHEVAHLFDGLSGAIDGRPPLLSGMSPVRWTEVFQHAYDSLQAALADGRESLVDPYAAEAPEEFFAVALEHYCLRPDWLEQECPAVAAQMRALFGPIHA
jgi:Mlc titration factor MtfA (ptsG expression regulator)